MGNGGIWWHLGGGDGQKGAGKVGGQPCCPVGCSGATENTDLAVPGGMETLQL